MTAFLKEHQENSDAKFAEIARESQRLVLKMREDVKEKNEEVGRMNARHFSELEAIKAEIAQEYEAHFAEQSRLLQDAFEKEKNVLLDKVRNEDGQQKCESAELLRQINQLQR